MMRLLSPNDLARAAIEAHARTSAYTLRTPLLHSEWLSGAGACDAFLKLESEQHTNSFKVRGALNKLLSLDEQQLARGLVTCSTGNHALAVLHACNALPTPSPVDCTIYLPTTAAAGKVAKLRARGARVLLHGSDCVVAEAEARRVAAESGRTYVSPYNDQDVMAGQGALGLELVQQLQEQLKLREIPQQQQQQQQQVEGEQPQPDEQQPQLLDVAIVPVGGGGLIAGVAAVLKAAVPGVHVVGASPAASPVMARSAVAGQVLDDVRCDAPTLSDATAGGIEPGAVTLEPCMRYVDEWVDVDEKSIADALVSLLEHEGKLAEGAAGVGLAAFAALAAAGRLRGARVAVVVCGGNIGLEGLSRVLSTGQAWGKGPLCQR